jgi:pyruvate/2-oxoglutarate/acetoin dehydrogenase E1 component
MTVRKITFRQAIKEALYQSMKSDNRVFLIGCGVTSPAGIFGSIEGILKEFGEGRVLEVPVAENGIAGVAIGAALTGLHPVMIYQRMDFALLAMDQIINHAAKWSYMFAGKMRVPLTVRGVIGKGWGQGAQHSQSLQALFAHIPGLKVVMPSNPYDAKGLLISSINENNPVIFIEHRSLYEQEGEVPSGYYSIPLGKARVLKKGKDVTVVALSIMALEAKKAALELQKEDKIDIEIIDPRCLKPLDEKLILDSVRKTGRLIIADADWKSCGITAEISALVAELGYNNLKAPIRRISLPETPTPTSSALENFYYPRANEIIQAARELVYSENKIKRLKAKPFSRSCPYDENFRGPF